MRKRIHVNSHVIRRNHKDGTREPPLTIKAGRTNLKAHTLEILGPSRVIYSPDRPLSCGARVWIETYAPLRVDGTKEEINLP
jgi:hypothetical protein